MDDRTEQTNGHADVDSSSTRLLPPCKVCGEPGTGFHYGVNTCGACKGFFRRSLTRVDPYLCVKNYLCRVGPGTNRRQSCPKCRYEKCLAVGMSKEACKVGRYNVIKISEDTEEALKFYQSEKPDKSANDNNNANERQKSVHKSKTEDIISPPKTFLKSSMETQSSNIPPNYKALTSSKHDSNKHGIHVAHYDSRVSSGEERDLAMGPPENTDNDHSEMYRPKCVDNNSLTLSSFNNDCFTSNRLNESVPDFSNNDIDIDPTTELNDDNIYNESPYTILEHSTNYDSMSSCIDAETRNSYQTSCAPTSTLVNERDTTELFPHEYNMVYGNSSRRCPKQNPNHLVQTCSAYNQSANPGGSSCDSILELPTLSEKPQQSDSLSITKQTPSSSFLSLPQSTHVFTSAQTSINSNHFAIPQQLGSQDVCAGSEQHSCTHRPWPVFGSKHNRDNEPPMIKIYQSSDLRVARTCSTKPTRYCPIGWKKQNASATTGADLTRDSTSCNTDTVALIPKHKGTDEYGNFTLHVVAPDPMKHTMSMFEQFPFTSFEKKSLAPLLKLCYEANTWIENYMDLQPLAQPSRVWNKDNAPNETPGAPTFNVSIMSSTQAAEKLSSMQDVAYSSMEIDNLLDYLLETHCRIYGPESAFLNRMETLTYQELFMKICQMHDSLKGRLNLIEDDKYFTVLESTGIDVDKRKEWFTCNLQNFEKSFVRTTKFLLALPGFKQLPLNDRVILAKATMPHLMALRHCQTTSLEYDSCIDQERGVFLRISTFKKIIPGSEEYLPEWYAIAKDMQALDLCFHESVMIKILFIIRLDVIGELEKHALVTEWRNIYLKCLLQHERKRYGPIADDRFKKILDVLQALQDLCATKLKTKGMALRKTILTLAEDKDQPLLEEVLCYWDKFRLAEEVH